MADVAALTYRIDSTDAVTAGKRLDGMDAAAKRASGGVDTLSKSNAAASRTTAALVSTVKRLAVSLGAIFSVGAVANSAGQYQVLTNSLMALGFEADEAALQLERIGEIANKTRTPLEATARLYQRISIASKELGASQQDVERFTENVGLALGATGISAQEASGALLQLSQAMAGGVVRAEEFNSILEGAFPLAQAAANGIDEAGGSVGRLRQLVIEGKVSSDEFFNAILSQSEQLQESFDNTNITISQALTNMGSALTLFIGHMDGALGVSTAIANAIQFLTDNFSSAQGYIIAAATAVTAYYTPAIIAATYQTGLWIASLVTLRGALIASGIGAFVVLAGSAVNWLLRLKEETGSWGEALRLLGAVAQGVWEGITASAGAIPVALRAVWELVKADFYTLLEGMTQRWSEFLSTLSINMSDIPGFGGIGERLGEASASAFGRMSEFNAKASAAASSASRLKSEASSLASEGFEKAAVAAGKLSTSVSRTSEEAVNLSKEVTKVNEILSRTGTGGSGGGVGSGGANDGLTTLLGILGQVETEDPYEKVYNWYQQANQALMDSQLIERGMLERHNEYKLQIERLYQDQLAEVRRQERDKDLGSYESFFGTMAQITASGGEKMLAISKAFGVAEAIVSMWRGAAKALELPFPANMAAWAKVLATGAQAVNGIKSASAGGEGRGAAPTASGTTAVQEPERVTVVELRGPEWIQNLVQPMMEEIYEQTRDGTRVIFQNGN